MPRQSCPFNRGASFSVPGPLFGRVERRSEPVAEAPAPSPAPAVLPTRRSSSLANAEMHIRRYPNPIPASCSTPATAETLCLLRAQNELLTELLAAVNSLTAATLATARKDGKRREDD